MDRREQIVDVVHIDGAHGGNLENFSFERAFSAVDDETALAKPLSERFELEPIGEKHA